MVELALFGNLNDMANFDTFLINHQGFRGMTVDIVLIVLGGSLCLAAFEPARGKSSIFGRAQVLHVSRGC